MLQQVEIEQRNKILGTGFLSCYVETLEKKGYFLHSRFIRVGEKEPNWTVTLVPSGHEVRPLSTFLQTSLLFSATCSVICVQRLLTSSLPPRALALNPSKTSLIDLHEANKTSNPIRFRFLNTLTNKFVNFRCFLIPTVGLLILPFG